MSGTTTLFAAMNVPRRRGDRPQHAAPQASGVIRFLNAVEREVPAGKTVHAILDNYAAHKHPNVRRWLERHPRWTFHFTPTSASWLNAVEGFFATLTKRRLKRGVFRSVADLQAAINHFLEQHNQKSQPFAWTADPDKIIAAVRRGRQVSDLSTLMFAVSSSRHEKSLLGFERFRMTAAEQGRRHDHQDDG